MVPINAVKNSLTRDAKLALAPFVTKEDKEHHHEVFGDDYSACLNWYRRGIRNLGVDEEKEQLRKREIKGKIAKETLFIAGLRDATSPAERGKTSMNGNVEGGEGGGKLKMVSVDSGHWIMLEKAEETNSILKEFFEKGVEKVGVRATL
jgi:soluble epoxide hydrolase/lipid-phosphate phosphatase